METRLAITFEARPIVFIEHLVYPSFTLGFVDMNKLTLLRYYTYKQWTNHCVFKTKQYKVICKVLHYKHSNW